MWAGISSKGKTKAFLFTENLTADLSRRILREALLPSLKRLGQDMRIVQQDNDPKHNAKRCLAVLAEEGISRVLQPPQSPDLNPVENVWDLLKDRVAEHSPETVDELKKWIRFEWDKLKKPEFLSTISSMPQRCQAVLDANGGPTRY